MDSHAGSTFRASRVSCVVLGGNSGRSRFMFSVDVWGRLAQASWAYGAERGGVRYCSAQGVMWVTLNDNFGGERY